MSNIKIGDIEFYFELHGVGQPLVLVSGYTADHRYWLPILSDLARYFQVLIFDNRAVGQTKDSRKIPLTIDSMADDVMALVKALGLKKPHVVGQSMGGSIVQSIAARYSDQINKLGIINSTAKWRQAVMHGLKNMLLLRKKNASFDSQLEATLAWVFGEKFLLDQEKISALRTILMNDPWPQSFENQTRQFAALEQFDSRAYLNKITVPTLIISGLQDVLSLPSESAELAKKILDSKLITLDCAHAPIAELPDETIEVMMDFFSRNVSPLNFKLAFEDIYPPHSEAKLGNNTANFFDELPQSIEEPLDVMTLRKAISDWDQDYAFAYPKNVSANSFKEEIIEEVPASIYRADNKSANTPTIVFLHGGGFFCELANIHKSLLANIIERIPCHAVLPHYSLAPENKAPKAINEIINILRTLLIQFKKYELTKNLVVIGYSSGGNLAWNAVLDLLNLSESKDLVKQISNVILMSPWVDLSMITTEKPYYEKQQNSDKMLQSWALKQMRDWYLPEGTEKTDSRFSPVYRPINQMQNMPSTTIIAGELDRLLTDSVKAMQVLKQAGVCTELVVLQGQSHNHSCHAKLRDGVFTADVISAVIQRKPLHDLIGDDGLGLHVIW